MANTLNTNFFNMASQSKPQWKIRMASFLEGVDPGLTEFLHNPPYIPTIVVPSVPATATIVEAPEQIRPKDEKDWSPQERLRHDLAEK